MSLAITELELTDVNTISIPTDAILILSLLIIFALLGYFFHNILDNQTNQFIEKVDNNSNLELVKEQRKDQLILESTTANRKKSKKTNIKEINVFSPSKLLGIGSLAVIAIGGSSLVGIENIRNSFKSVNNNQINIKTADESAKSFLSMAKIKSSNQLQTNVKKISYVDTLLSTNNSSKTNSFSQIKGRETVDFFSF